MNLVRCYICMHEATEDAFLAFRENGDSSGRQWYACANHGVSERVEAWQRTKADRDYWPIELAHPYDEAAERLAAAEARADAQTATLVAGKTRATRVVHDLAPNDDPTRILDMPDPLAEPARGGWIPNRPAGFERLSALGAAILDQWGRSGMAVYHIDGNPRNNAPENLAVVPIR